MGGKVDTSASTDRGFTVGVMTLCAVLLLPILTFRMGLDQGVFAYLGAELLAGRWPYIDTWDHAFPGLMFLNAGEIFLFGKSVVMFRFFDWLWQLACCYLVFAITRRLADRAGAYVAAALYALIYQGYGFWNTAQREGFAVLFVLWGFWLCLTASRRRPILTALGIGLGLGLAATIKPTMLALSALYAPLLFRLNRRSARLALAGGAALLAPALSIATLYWSKGSLGELYDACVVFQAQVYVPLSRGTDPLLVHWLSKLGRLGLQTWAIALGYLPFLFWGGALGERRMLYFGYVGAVYAVFVQGTFAGYHFLPGLALGAALLGTMFSWVGSLLFRDARLRAGRFRLTAALALAHLLVLAAIPLYLHRDSIERLVTLQFLQPPEPGEMRNDTVFDFTEDWELAEYLRASTAPEDRLQVWGHESLVYYLADRHAASRFQTSNPLVTRAPGRDLTPLQVRWREEFLSDLQRSPPRYIAVVRDDTWWWAPERQTSEELLDDFPAWKTFIDERYSPDRTVGRFLVYRQR